MLYPPWNFTLKWSWKNSLCGRGNHLFCQEFSLNKPFLLLSFLVPWYLSFILGGNIWHLSLGVIFPYHRGLSEFFRKRYEFAGDSKCHPWIFQLNCDLFTQSRTASFFSYLCSFSIKMIIDLSWKGEKMVMSLYVGLFNGTFLFGKQGLIFLSWFVW